MAHNPLAERVSLRNVCYRKSCCELELAEPYLYVAQYEEIHPPCPTQEAVLRRTSDFVARRLRTSYSPPIMLAALVTPVATP